MASNSKKDQTEVKLGERPSSQEAEGLFEWPKSEKQSEPTGSPTL